MFILKMKIAARTVRLSSLFLLLGVVTFLHGCSSSKPEPVVKGPDNLLVVQGRTMGTTYTVKLVEEPENLPAKEELQAWVNEVFAGINQSMSTYIEDSEISRLNRSPEEDWQLISPHLYQVLSLSQRVSRQTEGAFDVSVMPLVDLWGFGPAGPATSVPSEEQLAVAKAQIGYQHLELHFFESMLKKPSFLTLDLSAVAKGFGADELVRFLRAKGYENLMVEIGGDLAVWGTNPDGEPWRIGIEQPQDGLRSGAGQLVGAVRLNNVGMATSGDYRNYYEKDGVRYSHTIDPRTGRPITHNLASVTVISHSCAEADALATAFMVMGAEQALALAEEQDIALYMLVREEGGFAAYQSARFADHQ